MTFTAIDFETAQGYRWSICQVGLVRVVDGDVVSKIDMLVQPPDNYYWSQFTAIHGISSQKTRNAPRFNEIWHVLKPFIENQVVVAHNSRFDFGCLKATLEFYGIQQPNFQGACTYILHRKSLKTLCCEHGIPLNHHDALSDATACAELFMLDRSADSIHDQNHKI